MAQSFHEMMFGSVKSGPGLLAKSQTANGLAVTGKRAKTNSPITMWIDWVECDKEIITRYVCERVRIVLASGNSVTRSSVIAQSAAWKFITSEEGHEVVIMDGMGAFEIDVCRALIKNLSLLKNVLILRETDQLKYLIAVSKFVREKAAFSMHLKLLIFFCYKNPSKNDERIVKLIKCLTHNLNLRVIIVTDGRWNQARYIEMNEDGKFTTKSAKEVRDIKWANRIRAKEEKRFFNNWN